jgi:hypothetical protein
VTFSILILGSVFADCVFSDCQIATANELFTALGSADDLPHPIPQLCSARTDQKICSGDRIKVCKRQQRHPTNHSRRRRPQHLGLHRRSDLYDKCTCSRSIELDARSGVADL